MTRLNERPLIESNKFGSVLALDISRKAYQKVVRSLASTTATVVRAVIGSVTLS
ncbi:unnamed protein product [Meloidogyne enterolobii]|uniref:Uncharacterized protein n=1 Tax=Meloidogyne enterolobii TaxID=390850 RepID=A0ACB0ZBU1_MELEN